MTASATVFDFAMPAEWAEHRATWLAWPSHVDLWGDQLEPARRQFADLCRAIVSNGPEATAAAAPEQLEVLVLDDEGERGAVAALAGLPVRFHHVAFGDIWLRDTGPIFLLDRAARIAAARFRFNGWGGKYRLPGDDEVASRIVRELGVRSFDHGFVLEGGAVEVDGEGTCLTTRQCLLNANRNSGASEAVMERRLREALGVSDVLWLDEGLAGDHTDGHVDNVARFARPGVVLCMTPAAGDDPNREVLVRISEKLAAFTDSSGRRLEVVTLPSPGRVEGEDGDPVPASYMNFYVSNASVVVPVYDSKYDSRAVEVIASCFPGRAAIGLPARAILTGGGAFHCITQPEPRSAGRA